MVFTSVPYQLEITFRRTLCPGAGEFSMIGTDIVQFAFRGNVYRFARRILRVGFDANCPICHVEPDVRDLDGIVAGVKDSADGLAVPGHNECQMITLADA